jgi:serine/threonine protein kinase
VFLGSIGAGGSSEVFLAREHAAPGVHRDVALMLLAARSSHDPEWRASVLDEARLLAQLSHPNVVSFLGVYDRGGRLGIVLEHVRGGSVRELLAARAARAGLGLGSRVGLGIAVQIAEGLGYLHGITDELGNVRDFVHRDLTPRNVSSGITAGSRSSTSASRGGQTAHGRRRSATSREPRATWRRSRRIRRGASIDAPTCTRSARCSRSS